jgi:hypothetical protein
MFSKVSPTWTFVLLFGLPSHVAPTNAELVALLLREGLSGPYLWARSLSDLLLNTLSRLLLLFCGFNQRSAAKVILGSR